MYTWTKTEDFAAGEALFKSIDSLKKDFNIDCKYNSSAKRKIE